MSRTIQLLTIGILFLCSSSPSAAETIGWRLGGDGRYPDTRPPLRWAAEENVVWRTALSATSNASPLVLEDASRVFVLSEPDEIVAIDSATGKIAWAASTADITADRVGAHKANGWTSATPVSDGSQVFAVFGSGVVAAYSVAGERLWARAVEQPKHRWGHSASPVLAGGKLFVHLDDLIALDPKTGSEVWRAESEVTFGSPATAQVAGTDLLITASGDVFTADSGERIAAEIGHVRHSTPVVQDGHVYFIEKRATAVRLPDSLDAPFEQLWEARIQGSRHYASPLVHDGRLYAVSREQNFSILDSATGELLHQRQLDLDSGANTAYPSISLAGDRIYLSTENGTTVVLKPGNEYEEIARNTLEGFRSSLAFAGDRIYVRTFGHLYCLGS